jgi:hypothetical protein
MIEQHKKIKNCPPVQHRYVKLENFTVLNTIVYVAD